MFRERLKKEAPQQLDLFLEYVDPASSLSELMDRCLKHYVL
jgi:hypothetical protein